MIVVKLTTPLPSIGARAGQYVAVNRETGRVTVFHHPPTETALAELVASAGWSPIRASASPSEVRAEFGQLRHRSGEAGRPHLEVVR